MSSMSATPLTAAFIKKALEDFDAMIRQAVEEGTITITMRRIGHDLVSFITILSFSTLMNIRGTFLPL